MNRKINWKETLLKLLLGIFLLGLFFGGIYLLLHILGYDNISQEQLQDLIAKTGVYGKLCFILITFLQVTFIPIPSAITILAGSYLFGMWWSFILSLIGSLLGSMFAYFLGRSIGRKFVDWAMGGKESVDYYLEKLKGKETVLLFFMFLLPAFPDDALCSVAGITNMKTPTFTIIQIITRPIGILGTLFFMSGEYIPYEGWGLALIIGIGLLSIIGFLFAFKYSDKINNFLENMSLKITNLLKRRKEK